MGRNRDKKLRGGSSSLKRQAKTCSLISNPRRPSGAHLRSFCVRLRASVNLFLWFVRAGERRGMWRCPPKKNREVRFSHGDNKGSIPKDWLRVFLDASHADWNMDWRCVRWSSRARWLVKMFAEHLLYAVTPVTTVTRREITPARCGLGERGRGYRCLDRERVHWHGAIVARFFTRGQSTKFLVRVISAADSF